MDFLGALLGLGVIAALFGLCLGFIALERRL